MQKETFAKKKSTSSKVNPIDKTVGDNIRRARKSKDLTIKELARMIGMSESGLWYLEKGWNAAKPVVLFKLGEALDVYPFEFLTGMHELYKNKKKY